MVLTQIIVLIILIVLSAFFSGVETATVSISLARVRALVKQKKRGSSALYRMKQNPRRLIITILIGNNLVNIAAAAIAAILFTDLFGSKGIGIATGIMTLLILVFGEITPKTFAAQNSERVSLIAAKPLEILSYIFLPFVGFFELIAKGMLKILGSKKEKQLSEEELKTVVTMGKEEGILSEEAAEMIHNLIEFEDTKVVDIMTSRINVKMINGEEKLGNVLNFIIRSGYSRYPVYLDARDEIIGILDVDDVLKYMKNKKLNTKIKKIIRPVKFVPEYKEIDDLLSEFGGKKVPMAIVVNEYGSVSGIVTVEDILEEIVGDIFDKSKRKSIYIKKISDKLIMVDAKATVEEVNKILHLGLKEEHFNTIAGFVTHKLKKIPKKGERITLKNVIIEVDKVTKQEIKSVKIIKV